MASLAQLLAAPELGLRLMQSGPDDPEISWVSTTELLDLGRYLEGGEIVLTTGLTLDIDDPRWLDFAAGLSRARIAAIGFGVGVVHERIPPPLIAAASAYRLALFEVPPPTPFIAVSKAVAALLQADELRAAHRALQAQQRLLEGARGSQDAAEVLASIAQATGRRLALHGGDGLIAQAAGFSETAGETETIPLDSAGTVTLLVAPGRALGPEERAVITAGAMVLGLELSGARGDAERERIRWARLTEGLLRGEPLGAAAGILDPELRLPDRIRVIAAQGAAESLAGWRRAPRHGLDRLITAGRTDIRTAGSGIAVAHQLCADTPEALERAIASLQRFGLDCVVGRAAALPEAPVSLHSAERRITALSPLAQLYTDPRIPRVIRVEEDAPLLDALLRGEGASAAVLGAAVLGPLARGASGSLDAGEHEMLRATLRVFLARNGQRAPAAAELGIHRNTLRDRLARIERLTGREVDDADHRAELWLGLRIEESLG